MYRFSIFIAALALLPGAAGQEERTPWTTSRITGSPEPPPPFRARRVFPHLTFKKPLCLVPFPDYKRYVVIEEDGILHTIPNHPECRKPDLFIDLHKEILNLDKVDRCKGIQSSYAIAFDPNFAKNRLCYVMYVLASKEKKIPLANGSRISRFRVTEADPPRIEAASEEVIITWLAGGHNGCDLHFGNDGNLYFSTGDAEDPMPPDKLRTGQNIDDLMSIIGRIDVRRTDPGKAYAIPPDNPFVKTPGARGEIWAYGLRNPWRMSFDRKTGRLWITDVGWERWELIYCAEKGGENFGWSLMEGPEPCIPDVKPGPTPIVPPAHALPHTEGTSITAGYVYRGKMLKGYEGWFVYGDWETRRVWANPVRGNTLGDRKELARTDVRVVSFAEDPDGELLIVDYEAGGIHGLEPNDAGARNAEFPRQLSRTGLFSSVREQTPSPGVIPFSIRVPRWADGAAGQRWIAIPGRESIQHIDKNQQWPRESVWPRDSVMAKTLSLGERRLETQVLHFDGRSWNGYSYVWNPEQADAALAPAEGGEIDLGGGRKWKVPSRAACMMCHNPWPGYALTLNPAQLVPIKQFQDWKFMPGDLGKSKPLVDPHDESAPLDARARSYLAANCGHCHRFGGGGAAKILLINDLPLPETFTHGVRASLGAFELTDPNIVSGGDPARSVLYFRMSKLGQGRMPHLGSEVVDEKGLRLIRRWIESLPETPCDSAAARAEDRKALDRLRSGDLGALDRLLSGTTSALELVGALETLPEAARRDAMRRALALPPGLVRDLFERFEPHDRRRVRLGTSIKPGQILALKGDAERGRKIFTGTTIQCSKCHRVGEGPETVGPDLSRIAANYKREQLLESLLEPSKVMDPKRAGYTVLTKSGDVFSAVLLSKTDAEIVFRDVEKEIRLAPSAIERMAPQLKSLMPDGLLQHLTAQEAADLLAFLESLR